MLRKFLDGFYTGLDRALRKNASFYGLVAQSEYDIVYKWYKAEQLTCEELKTQNTDLLDRVRTREDAIVEDLLTIKDLHVQVEHIYMELSGADRRFENLQDEYNAQLLKLSDANETIEKMAIEISGLRASLAKRLPGRPRKEVGAAK